MEGGIWQPNPRVKLLCLKLLFMAKLWNKSCHQCGWKFTGLLVYFLLIYFFKLHVSNLLQLSSICVLLAQDNWCPYKIWRWHHCTKWSICFWHNFRHFICTKLWWHLATTLFVWGLGTQQFQALGTQCIGCVLGQAWFQWTVGGSFTWWPCCM